MARERTAGGARPPTRGAISRRQRESRIQRIIFATGILVIVLVLALMGTGWYLTRVRPLYETAFRVNGTDIDMRFYVDTLVVSGPSGAEESIPQQELVRQAALKLGIVVSEEEASQLLGEELTARDIPVTKQYLDVLNYKVLVKKLQDEYFDEQVPITALQRDFLAMYLESESRATVIRDRLVAGEDFAKLAEELSLDTKTQEGKGSIGWHPKGVLSAVLGSSTVDDAAFSTEVGAVSQPIQEKVKSKNVGYWIFNILERNSEEARVQVMLLGNEKEAKDIRARLEAGEDFVALAKEFSQMPGAKGDGGDIGQLKKGDRGEFFDANIFDPNIPAPSISQPVFDKIPTTGGCWLIKVVDEANGKVISNEDRDSLKLREYYNWVVALWNDPEKKVENLLTPETKTWALEAARREQREIANRAKNKTTS